MTLQIPSNFERDVKSKLKEIKSFLKPEGKNLLITHSNCMDGIGCVLVSKMCLKNVDVIETNYTYVDDVFTELDHKYYDAIIFADMSVVNVDLSKHNNIIMIDHHESALPQHDPDNFKFIDTKACGAYLLKCFFSLYYDRDLSFLDDFSGLMNDYDLWYHLDPRSKDIKKLHIAYDRDKFIKKFALVIKKDGKIVFDDEDKLEIAKYDEDLKNTIDDLEYTEKYKKIAIFSSDNYVNDITSHFIEQVGMTYAICIFPPSRTGHHVSVRSSGKSKKNLGSLLKKYGGGGHAHAAGLKIKEIHLNKMIKAICKELHAKDKKDN